MDSRIAPTSDLRARRPQSEATNTHGQATAGSPKTEGQLDRRTAREIRFGYATDRSGPSVAPNNNQHETPLTGQMGLYLTIAGIALGTLGNYAYLYGRHYEHKPLCLIGLLMVPVGSALFGFGVIILGVEGCNTPARSGR